MTLTEFLLARIAEDEYEARHPDEDIPSKTMIGGRVVDCDSRALAECEAKRRIVAEHEMTTIRPAHVEGYWWSAYCRRCTMDGEYADITKEPREEPCVTLLAIAAVYADHPDYREEWRP